MTIFDPYKQRSADPTSLNLGRATVSPTLLGTDIGRIDQSRPQASGALYALGFVLGWAAIGIPLILAALVYLTPLAVDEGWQTPEPVGVDVLVMAGTIVPMVTAVLASILAAVGRRRIKGARNGAGAVWLAVSFGVLALATVWIGNTTGIPFP
ncbi:hypothetical protein EXU48_06920 [Occultella glacieicola]|uniref:Uncharacterized protein n=1 Tax=Occultella glacieicola TaxID=2518684 RepID=A0ABY2E5V6_9MICO|nr:hypothetical protein [Occultella glacieicola]TDE95973.1 hypothetical protein EXU48_06920 [Occultella glacieicola]